MVSRLVVSNYGIIDLIKTGTVINPGGNVATLSTPINSNLESATIQSPIIREEMWAFIGAQYGSYSNFVNTSVVSTTGPSGTTSKVLDQYFPATVSGSTSNYAMPPTGTGIALTSTPLKGGAVEEATIEFDFRAVSSGVPWGWGGKIPGLGGLKPGASGGVPTGGQPSPNGWSGRCMFRRIGTTANANMSANLVGYFYAPYQPADSIGNDLATGKTLQANTWHHIKQYYKMNTVVTEGDTSPPADGIHRIWLDGILCYEATNVIYRFYTDAMITHLVWDNFYGGSDTADAPNTWGPVADTHHQFDNLVVVTGDIYGSATPSADTTPPTTPASVVASNITSSGFSLNWAASSDAFGVTRYSIQLNGATYMTSTTNSAVVTGLTPSTAYAVRITARDAAGNYSGLSNAISVTTNVDNTP